MERTSGLRFAAIVLLLIMLTAIWQDSILPQSIMLTLNMMQSPLMELTF